MATSRRIPVEIKIGNDTYKDDLTPGKTYKISRAWTTQDKAVNKERKGAIFAAFDWLNEKWALMAQQPSIKVIETYSEYFDEYTWEASSRAGDPAKRSWSSGTTLSLTWVLTFRRSPTAEDLEVRALRAASALYEDYLQLSERARENFDQRLEEHRAAIRGPAPSSARTIYALGKTIDTGGRELVVVRDHLGLRVADKATLEPVCDHAHGEELIDMQRETGVACPSCWELG